MSRNFKVFLFTAIVFAVAFGGTAHAVPLILDFTGFSWSTRSNGDPTTFAAVGVLDGFSIPVNDLAETYTFSLSGLVLANVTTRSPSVKEYAYAGGILGIYRSTGPSNRPYSYGTNPTSTPASFVDGTPWLYGGLSDFVFIYNTTSKAGLLNAHGSFTSGEFAGNLEDATWSAPTAVTGRANDGIPAGYDYRLEGQATTKALPVPEPATLALFGLGLAGGFVALLKRRGA